MKKTIIAVVTLLMLCNVSFGQVAKEESKSKSIAFSAQAGSLIKKEFYPIGKVKGVEFEVLIMTDILKNEKMGCLRLKTSDYSSKDEYIGTLDLDEIDACVKSLEFIKDKLLTTVTENYTECEYKSKDGVKFGAYSEKTKWTAFIYTKSYTYRSASFFNSDELGDAIGKLNESKEKINSLLLIK